MQVLRDIKEQHEIVFIFGAEDDGADVFNHVKPCLLVHVASGEFKCVDVLRCLNIDSLLLLSVASRTDSSQLIGALRVHDVLVGGLELCDNRWCHYVCL